jgi:uncharacterized protein (TIGR02611 family)
VADVTDAPRSRLVDRLQQRREAYRRKPALYRAAWVTVGMVITAAGVGMLVLPGPAFVVIPIGLAMLSLEFKWAERALDLALEHAEKAQAAAKETSPRTRILTAAAGVAVIAGLVTWAVLGDIWLVPWV